MRKDIKNQFFEIFMIPDLQSIYTDEDVAIHFSLKFK